LFLGKVIGNIWATKKYKELKNFKLMFEIIYYITASESVIPLPVDMAPVDASIVGIVDTINQEN
jgi:microcompartment protein CcmK/EutM